MAFDPVSIGLLGGGLSVLGGILGGSSASKQAKAEQAAAAQTRQDSIDNSVMTNYARLRALFGDDATARNYLRDLLPRELQDQYLGVAASDASFTPQEQARLQAIDQELAQANRSNSGGAFGWGNANRAGQNASTQQRVQALQAEKAALMAKSGGNPGQLGKINSAPDSMMGGSGGGGLLAQYAQLANQSQAGTNQLLGAFGRDTQQGLGAYDSLITQAGQYGAGQEERIRRDAASQEKRLNQGSLAALAARGVGGSNVLAALNGNSRSVNRDAQDQILNVNDGRIDRQLGIGSQRAGFLGQRLNTQAGIRGAGMDQFLSLSRLPLDLKSNVLLNPGQPQLVPGSGASPSGAFGSTIANSLAGVGGTLGGIGLQQWLTSQNQLAQNRSNPMGSAQNNAGSIY